MKLNSILSVLPAFVGKAKCFYMMLGTTLITNSIVGKHKEIQERRVEHKTLLENVMNILR